MKPEEMRSVVITRFGGPEVLEIQQCPLPHPDAGQVRIRVVMAGLNRADILQREGKYPAPTDAPPDVPGLEIMGTVDALGDGVTAWKKGQRVFGLVGGGGYAETVVTHERLLASVPDNLSDTEAGAVPEAFMTAHDALFSQADLKMGESVLIHAIGSGVATAALQLARAVGWTTFGTARSPGKIDRAFAMGLGTALPLPDFLPTLMSATSKRGVDVIIDFVGEPYFEANLQALAPKGRLVQVGTMAGQKAQINLGLLMQKRLRVMGTVLRSRPWEEKALVTQLFAQQVVPLLAQGTVKAVVDRVFPLAEVVEAHRYMESNANFGKVLLQMASQ